MNSILCIHWMVQWQNTNCWSTLPASEVAIIDQVNGQVLWSDGSSAAAVMLCLACQLNFVVKMAAAYASQQLMICTISKCITNIMSSTLKIICVFEECCVSVQEINCCLQRISKIASNKLKLNFLLEESTRFDLINWRLWRKAVTRPLNIKVEIVPRKVISLTWRSCQVLFGQLWGCLQLTSHWSYT